jgi:hypothetical protein
MRKRSATSLGRARRRNAARPVPPPLLAGATLMIHALPGLWTPGIFGLWETHAAPRFKDGEWCSSANYYEPKPAKDEYDHARDHYGFTYTVQPGNRVCFVNFRL